MKVASVDTPYPSVDDVADVLGIPRARARRVALATKNLAASGLTGGLKRRAAAQVRVPTERKTKRLGPVERRRRDAFGQETSKSRIVAALAERVGIPKKTSAAYLSALAALAHKEAKNGFRLPGIGTLVVRHAKARMGRNPRTGEHIQIKRRKRVRFRVAKSATHTIVSAK